MNEGWQAVERILDAAKPKPTGSPLLNALGDFRPDGHTAAGFVFLAKECPTAADAGDPYRAVLETVAAWPGKGSFDGHDAIGMVHVCREAAAKTSSALVAAIRKVDASWTGEDTFASPGDFISDVYEELGGVHAAYGLGLQELGLDSYMVDEGDNSAEGRPFDRALLAKHWPDVHPPENMGWDDLDRINEDAAVSSATWEWIEFGGKHHDRTTPDGVANFFDLKAVEETYGHKPIRLAAIGRELGAPCEAIMREMIDTDGFTRGVHRLGDGSGLTAEQVKEAATKLVGKGYLMAVEAGRGSEWTLSPTCLPLGRLAEEDAEAVVSAFLDAETGQEGTPFELHEDGETGWSFYVKQDDTTSYLHPDLRIEWYGTSYVPGEDADRDGPTGGPAGP